MNHSAATYNNPASTLNSVLRAAKHWQVVQQVPYHFALLKRQKTRPKFYDFDQFQWLVEAAGKVDPRIQLVTLQGGEAGLRRGEIIALEWPDVDLRRGLLTIERSEHSFIASGSYSGSNPLETGPHSTPAQPWP